MQHILIAGASRGIGLGLVKAFLAKGDRVHAIVRSADNPSLNELATLHPGQLKVQACDLASTGAAVEITDALAGTCLDLAIFNAGISGPEHQDERQVVADELAELFLINAIAPLRLAKALAPSLSPNGVLAFMSSQMGSVELARSASMPLYGASKAALNSLLQSWAHSAEPPQATLLALHPGWVKTDMGGESAPLSVEDSAAGLVSTIVAHQGAGGCHFVDYQGATLPW